MRGFGRLLGFCNLTCIACATVSPPAGEPDLEALLAEPEARVMWVGAHPDDEALAGPLLARACVGLGRPCLMFVMNRGDGGECLLPEGCRPDLGTVRAQELRLVAGAYGAELHHHRYWNAPLPMSSFPPRPEIGARWIAQGDPTDRLVRVIEAFRPTIVLTFDPNHGFTGHPEHQLASRFATAAVRRARVQPRVYHLLNRLWITQVMGADPGEPTETFDTHVPCGPSGRSCLDVALQISRAHRTQRGDMGRVRSLRPQFGRVFLRKIDPQDLSQAPEPLAP